MTEDGPEADTPSSADLWMDLISSAAISKSSSEFSRSGELGRSGDLEIARIPHPSTSAPLERSASRTTRRRRMPLPLAARRRTPLVGRRTAPVKSKTSSSPGSSASPAATLDRGEVQAEPRTTAPLDGQPFVQQQAASLVETVNSSVRTQDTTKDADDDVIASMLTSIFGNSVDVSQISKAQQRPLPLASTRRLPNLKVKPEDGRKKRVKRSAKRWTNSRGRRSHPPGTDGEQDEKPGELSPKRLLSQSGITMLTRSDEFISQPRRNLHQLPKSPGTNKGIYHSQERDDELSGDIMQARFHEAMGTTATLLRKGHKSCPDLQSELPRPALPWSFSGSTFQEQDVASQHAQTQSYSALHRLRSKASVTSPRRSPSPDRIATPSVLSDDSPKREVAGASRSTMSQSLSDSDGFHGGWARRSLDMARSSPSFQSNRSSGLSSTGSQQAWDAPDSPLEPLVLPSRRHSDNFAPTVYLTPSSPRDDNRRLSLQTDLT